MSHVIELLIALLGGLSALGGAAWFVYRFASKAVRNWRAMHTLHEEFGEEPVSRLSEIIRDVEATHGEIDIRQRIAERHLKIGVYVTRPDGYYTWVNSVLAESFGLDSSEATGHGWVAALDKDDQQRVYQQWKTSVQERLPYEERFRVVPNSGDPWIAQTEAWPVTNRDGELLCYVGYVVRK